MAKVQTPVTSTNSSWDNFLCTVLFSLAVVGAAFLFVQTLDGVAAVFQLFEDVNQLKLRETETLENLSRLDHRITKLEYPNTLGHSNNDDDDDRDRVCFSDGTCYQPILGGNGTWEVIR